MKRASEEELNSIAILATFDIDKPDDRVEYDIWFTSSNDKALDFISEFDSIDKELGDKVLMSPRYVFWSCPFCEEDYKTNDCFG